MKLQVEPPEKKKTTKSSSRPPSSTPSFSLLPDEITAGYLARISKSYYERLSIISKSFRSILSSSELYAARSHIGNTEQCLYVSLSDFHSPPSAQWFRLWINPNPRIKENKMKMVQIPHSNFTSATKSTVVVGSEIYLICGPYSARSSAVRILDCRTHSWRDAPCMNVARANPSFCVYDGKIYVLGGCKGSEEKEPWAEVFDIKAQTWERLPGPGTEVRKCGIISIEEMEGKIVFANLYKIYAYDTEQGKWECCGSGSVKVPRSDCLIENVMYMNSRCGDIYWYDISDGFLKVVKGLDSLPDNYQMNGDSGHSISKLVSFGGKLLLMWEEHVKDSTKIWCAEIVVERRDGGEVWGNVEWADVVHTVSTTSCQLVHCLAVSV